MVRNKAIMSFSLSKNLISEMDHQRGDVSRSCYVEKLLKKGLNGDSRAKT